MPSSQLFRKYTVYSNAVRQWLMNAFFHENDFCITVALLQGS